MVTEADTKNFISCEQAGSRYLEVKQNYGASRRSSAAKPERRADLEQRWLVIESQERRESDLKKLADKIDKDLRVAKKKLKELSSREFACAPDAIVAAKKLLKKSLYHELTARRSSAAKPERRAHKNSINFH